MLPKLFGIKTGQEIKDSPPQSPDVTERTGLPGPGDNLNGPGTILKSKRFKNQSKECRDFVIIKVRDGYFNEDTQKSLFFPTRILLIFSNH